MRKITPTKTMQEPHESSLEQFVTHCRISYRSILNNPRYVAAVVALADKLDEAEQSRDINHAAAKMALDQRDAIAAAAMAMVKKIDAIHASPDYEAVWALAGNCGLPYRGPNYSAELQALRAVLERGKCVMREFPAQENRVETGVVQFGDDWPGVFIRGDSCHAYSLYLKEVLDTFRLHPVAYANLAGLRALLESPLYTTPERGAVDG